MKKEFAEKIVKCIGGFGKEVKIYENYSGRGMYGKETTGVVHDSINDVFTAIALVAADLEGNDEEDLVDEFVEELRRVKIDNLDCSHIIY
jgi:hypothetical protein